MSDWSYVDLEISYVSTFEVQAVATVLTPEGSMYSFGCNYDALDHLFFHLGKDVPELLLKAVEEDLKIEVQGHLGDSQTTNYGRH